MDEDVIILRATLSTIDIEIMFMELHSWFSIYRNRNVKNTSMFSRVTIMGMEKMHLITEW